MIFLTGYEYPHGYSASLVKIKIKMCYRLAEDNLQGSHELKDILMFNLEEIFETNQMKKRTLKVSLNDRTAWFSRL